MGDAAGKSALTIARQNANALAATQARLRWWARSYRGAGEPYPAMASPPTVTIGGPASSINSSSYLSGVSVVGTDARLAPVGVIRTQLGTDYSKWNNATATDGTQSAGGLARLRFLTDAPAFEVALLSGQDTLINAIVDGQYVTRSTGVIPQVDNGGAARYMKFSFGTDAPFFYLSSATLYQAGTGYALNDIVAVVGGTFSRAATLRVVQLSGSGVATFRVEDGGAYSAMPTGAVLSTSAVTGSGSGATAIGANGTGSAAVWSRGYTTRRLRAIELLIGAASSTLRFQGINFAAQDSLLAWPVSSRVPKLLWVGDSQSAGTYLAFPGGHMPLNVAQRLGLHDNMVLSALGGTGWITANGTSPAWGHANRVADYIAAAPDVIVFDGSQNDGATNNALVTSTVGSVLTQLQQALPAVRIVLVGPVIGTLSSYVAALAAGAALAPDQGRVRLVDNIGEAWLTGTGKVTATAGTGNMDYYLSSDGAHLTQAGTEFRAAIEARRIGAALVSMVDGEAVVPR